MTNIANDLGTPPHLRRKLGNSIIAQTSTPASGSNGTQFVFKDAAGYPLSAPISGTAYLSTSATGLTRNAAGTSIAALTNGTVEVADATPLVGPAFDYTTTAAGLLGVTVTSGAGTYYIAFVQPNGDLVMSSAIVVN